MIPGDQVRVTVFVAVSPADAFEVFTTETDLWWGKGPRYRMAGREPGVLVLEPRVGGRLFERVELPSGEQLLQRGVVTAWEPPSRLVLDWRIANFLPDEKTEVEVTFTPVDGGTNVVVCHRGWAKIRADHPARHGGDVATFIHGLGGWWQNIMSSMREFTVR